MRQGDTPIAIVERTRDLEPNFLRELRLILRLLRFKRMHAQFGAIVFALCNGALRDGTLPAAAE